MGTEACHRIIDDEKQSEPYVDEKPATRLERQNLAIKQSMANELKAIGLSPEAIVRLLNITYEEKA